MFRPGALAGLVPAGAYRFANAAHDSKLAALAFALGCYRFTRYRKQDDKELKLELPGNVDGDDLSRIVEGVYLARDLINTPANDMGPEELEEAARTLAGRHGATVRSVVGDDLLEQNFPLIHAVGRAAARAPRLIDITWGDPSHPKVTLIGKGVCFDTGGLDIKPESGMLNMKKDMGGAACMLALAHMLMDRGTKLRLRVLIPAVENAISGSAFRPRDIYRSRKGLTGRDRQYRRGGPPGARRRDCTGGRGAAGIDRGHGDADRRRACCARCRNSAVLYRRRRARR